MSKILKKNILSIFFVITIILVVITLFITWNSEKAHLKSTETPEKIEILGTYYLERDNNVYKLPIDNNLNLSGYNKIIVKGNFDKDIPKNKMLSMRIDNMKVRIYVNEKNVYSFGDEKNHPINFKSNGNLWDFFVSPGISHNDDIKIELSNIYTNHVSSTFKTFLNNIYSGYENILILNNIRSKYKNLFLSMFILCMGIITSVFSGVMYYRKKSMPILVCFSGLAISSGIWFFIDFKVISYFIPYPIFNNSLDIISMLFTIFFLLLYFFFNLKSIYKKYLKYIAYIFIILINVTTIMQFTGNMDYYEFIPLIDVLCIISAIIISIILFYEVKKMKNIYANKLVWSIGIICIGATLDIICNYFEIISLSVWFKISFFIFLILQFIGVTQSIYNIICENEKVKTLQEIAYVDALTGVKNRRAYWEKINEINKNLNLGNIFIVIIFDINNLKIINDTLGHEKGDELIRNACRIITNLFKENSIYRIGGDEFVVILENLNSSDYSNLLKQLKDEMQKFIYNCICELDISFAHGVAIYNADSDKSYEDVFNRADKSMYINKSQMKCMQK